MSLDCDRCDQPAVWCHASGLLYLCGGHHAELPSAEADQWTLDECLVDTHG